MGIIQTAKPLKMVKEPAPPKSGKIKSNGKPRAKNADALTQQKSWILGYICSFFGGIFGHKQGTRAPQDVAIGYLTNFVSAIKSFVKPGPMVALQEQRPGARNVRRQPPQKSVLIAYLCWLFGGFFGLHHVYLHRDRHAFLWWSSFGGFFGIGWASEMFLIPGYVRDANEDPRFVAEFVKKLEFYQKPPYATKRFAGQVIVGYMYAQLWSTAIPQMPLGDIDMSFLHWGIPVCVSLGVWLVGNIGREQGVWWHCLAAAFVAYTSRFFLYDESLTLLTTSVVATSVFDTFSKQWRRQPPRRGSPVGRSLKIGAAVVIYCALWTSFLYFNGTIDDGNGEEIPVHEALRDFLKADWWSELKTNLYDSYIYCQRNGWYQTIKELLESMDLDKDANAYKVLGVSATVSQAELTAVYRKLCKEYHPDKVKDEKQRAEAHKRFIEIQQAYNLLSKIKSSRRRKNKRYEDDPPIVL